MNYIAFIGDRPIQSYSGNYLAAGRWNEIFHHDDRRLQVFRDRNPETVLVPVKTTPVRRVEVGDRIVVGQDILTVGAIGVGIGKDGVPSNFVICQEGESWRKLSKPSWEHLIVLEPRLFQWTRRNLAVDVESYSRSAG